MMSNVIQFPVSNKDRNDFSKLMRDTLETSGLTPAQCEEFSSFIIPILDGFEIDNITPPSITISNGSVRSHTFDDLNK
jgi:hypothetical protein